MNESTRKALVKYLDEKWWSEPRPLYALNYNRLFDCPDDADALRRKMVEKGDWKDFYFFSRTAWGVKDENIRHCSQYHFFNYLMENFNSLAGEWIRREGEGRCKIKII